jgi:hypothetical protein
VSTQKQQPPTTVSPPEKSSTKINKGAGGVSYKLADRDANAELTEEEQIAQIEQLMTMSKLFPTADPWGQRIETLGESFPVF